MVRFTVEVDDEVTLPSGLRVDIKNVHLKRDKKKIGRV